MTNPHLSSRNSFMSQAAARGLLHHWLGTTEGLKDTGPVRMRKSHTGLAPWQSEKASNQPASQPQSGHYPARVHATQEGAM